MRASPVMPPPGFDELSPEEKIEYLQELWDRMATHPEEIPVPEWQRALVRERLAAHERGEGNTISWTEVRREAQELLRKSRTLELRPEAQAEFVDDDGNIAGRVAHGS